ncbi:MAG: hypothetical protein WDN45_14825 [Caulobacteraceae bacterium]
MAGLQGGEGGFAEEGGFGPITVHAGRSAYWDSFMVQITNPKILLFFGAVCRRSSTSSGRSCPSSCCSPPPP